MKAVILCGGKGTRIREYTEDVPKPLIYIGDKPILWHIMKIYELHGITDFILCLGYKGEKIKEFFREGHKNWKITMIETGENSTKSERLQKAMKLITDDLFLLAYGDDVSDVSITEVIAFHKKSKKIVTLTAIPLDSDKGIVLMDNKGGVTEFREKPRIPNYYFNGGFFVMQKKIFDYLHLGELEKEVFEKLASENQIQAFRHDGFWKCMNTFKEAQELNEMWTSRHTPWKKWK